MTSISIIYSILLLVLNNYQETPYAQKQYWYTNNELLSEAVKHKADVFYIAPTCIWDWQDSCGKTMHHADRLKTEHRAALKPSLELAEKIFGDSLNFYSPYYRQITLNSWKEHDSIIESRFKISMADVQEAFDYYIKTINNGRPFIIAGFSQGAKCVVELLKNLKKEEYERMIAAYVIGYKVSAKDIMGSDNIVPAKDSIDTGVTICYNSAETPETVIGVAKNSAICINPLNWRTDSIPSLLTITDNAVRAVEQDATITEYATIHVDTHSHALIVSGINKNNYYFPSLKEYFPIGNYHLQELLFYQNYLRRNAILRMHAKQTHLMTISQ